jgi:hypothetical protein
MWNELGLDLNSNVGHSMPSSGIVIYQDWRPLKAGYIFLSGRIFWDEGSNPVGLELRVLTTNAIIHHISPQILSRIRYTERVYRSGMWFVRRITDWAVGITTERGGWSLNV